MQKPEFRQAISHAVDREAFAETVFLGAAVPIWGPITPGNQPWFWPDVPRYPHDVTRARELLKSIGLEDRNGNGVVEDAAGTEARFTVITQQGLGYYERGTAVLRDEAAKVGIALDVAPLEFGAMIERMLALQLRRDLHASAGHRPRPGRQSRFLAQLWRRPLVEHRTEDAGDRVGEAHRLDHAGAGVHHRSAARRRALLNDAQRILAENLPVLYFAAPRMYGAHSARLTA